jgi:hypothetical protein
MSRKEWDYEMINQVNEKSNFELNPYKGAGLIEFGMDASQVEALLGSADKTSVNHLKQRVDFRAFMNIGYSADEPQVVVHLGFGRQMEGVAYKGVLLFGDVKNLGFQMLLEDDGNPFTYLGFIVLLNLGITLTGFHDNDVSQQAVAMFQYGAWDARKSKLKQYKT